MSASIHAAPSRSARIVPTRLLSRILALDATTSAGAGLVLLLGAGHTAELLGLPVTLQRVAGLVLLVFAAFVASVARRATPSRAAVLAVIVVNLLWAIGSALLLLLSLVAPTGVGIAFVIVQAAAVAILAELQVIGLRRSPASLTAA